MKAICVYAGHQAGRHPGYARGAAGLGRLLAERGLTLVYGGGRTGLMGAVADGVLKAGGRAVGVIPKGLMGIELEHTGLTELIVTPDMHTRKAKMHGLSDGFIALPGGFGTFDEFFEALCWAQLGIHSKPCGLLNINGYYDPLLKLVKAGRAEGFVPGPHAKRVLQASTPRRLLDAMLK